jgi:RNA polymerase-binding transcription factor DksA
MKNCGIFENCEDDISTKWLEVIPQVRLCIDCAWIAENLFRKAHGS